MVYRLHLPPDYYQGQDPEQLRCAALAYLADMRTFIDETIDYSSMSSAHFIVSRHWQRTVPPEAQRLVDRYRSIEHLVEDCTQLASGEPLFDWWPTHFNAILSRARALSLPRALLPTEQSPQTDPFLIKLLHHLGADDQKGYEVSRLAATIAGVARERGITRILDLGAGQGYLSAVLAFYYGLDVIGVDSDPVQTQGAEKKKRTLTRWQKVKMASTRLDYVTRYITKGEDIIDLWRTVGRPLAAEERWLLCGLHTCGDLAPSILHIFLHTQTDSVVNVGCCYNLIESSFPSSQLTTASFPTMDHAQRMLATQAPWRWRISKEQNEGTLRKHWYRACLQALLVDKGVEAATDVNTVQPGLQTGKMRPHAFGKGFYHYAQVATAKMSLKEEVKFTEEDALRIQHAAEANGDEKALVLSVLLRACIGPVLESVILVDRWLYLTEAMGEQDTLAIYPVFDPIASPRNMLFVAHRSQSSSQMGTKERSGETSEDWEDR